MKKRFVSTLAALALTASITTPVLAWQPSQTQTEVGATAATVTKSDGTSVTLEVTTTAVTDSTTNQVVNVKTSTQPIIKVTPVSETLAANQKIKDATKTTDTTTGEETTATFGEIAAELTETSLDYATNASTNAVFNIATQCDTTTTFLSKMNETLLEEVTTKAQEQLGETATVEDYTLMAAFDVTASEGAIAELGTDGVVTVELEIPGIKVDGNYIGIHFLGELDDPEAVEQEFQDDFDNALANYDAEVIDVVPVEEGKCNISLSSFSPVIILSEVEEVADVEATAAPSATAEVAETETASSGNNWILPLVLVVAAGGCGYGVYASKKKKSDSEKKA